MDYRTYTPEADLAAFVKCYWTLEAENEPQKQSIVPDGCMEMLFHYGDLYKQYIDQDEYIIQPRCFVFGQIVKPLEIAPTGSTGIFSVRFHPDGMTPLLNTPVSDMKQKAVALADVWGEEGEMLQDAVLSAADTRDRIALVEAFLTKRLLSPECIDRITQSGIATIVKLSGQLSIDELSDNLNIGRRQLERRFASAIGLSPKQLSKIVRLQATLKKLADNKCTSLTEAAYESDYYDQAHFIKDFKEFTGTSPKHFYASSLKMSALFIDAD